MVSLLKLMAGLCFGGAGKLDKTAVLKAICSGYEETTDPPVCLSESIETDECMDNNGGCWHSGSITACKVCCITTERFCTYL